MDANGWIAVTERLPEPDPGKLGSDDVLVYVPPDEPLFFSGRFTAYYMGGWCDSLTDDELGGVTHWQPLPPPPTEATA